MPPSEESEKPIAYDDPDGSTIDGRDSLERKEEESRVFDDDYEEADIPKPVSQRGIGGFLRRIIPGRQEEEDAMPVHQRRVPSRRHRERIRRGEEAAELMYEMEEGGDASESPSRNPSDLDLSHFEKKRRKPLTRRQMVLIHVGIITFFVLLVVGATKMSNKAKQPVLPKTKLTSNGTSLFAPTTILISLDGFRADFLTRGLTPTLNAFIKEGVSPLYMLPPFPSVTFVSHYSMSTGMYAEQHGIVGNTFWDPDMKEEFYYTDVKHSMQPKWWGGEPFWVTAEKHGVKTAIHMWPGSEAHVDNVDLSFVDKYNGSEVLGRKIDRVLGWLDLPGPKSEEALAEAERPQLIVAYVPNVDADGHQYGPNSTETRKSIKEADNMLEGIFAGIRERNLSDIVNVVVVSDHGMATTSTDRLIQLDDLIDMNKIAHTDGWPLYGLRPKFEEDLDDLYRDLKQHSIENPNFDVYLRDKDMPEEYHFSKNPRIAPLWMVPKTGWAIVQKQEFDIVEAKEKDLVYQPRGLHGYDYRHPLMRAIFVARGPAFPHQHHSRVEPFQNINIYNIICDTLGVDPSPNNGTLRLPFKVQGLHSDPNAPGLELPDDLPETGTGPVPSASASSTQQPLASQTSSSPSSVVNEPTAPVAPVLPEQPTPPEQPNTPDEPNAPKQPQAPEHPDEEKKPGSSSWWNWLGEQLEEAKGFISGLFGGTD